MISIIIPTYNNTNKLENAVNSILKQSVPNLEIIIIDDSLNGRASKVIEKINHPAIKYYKNSKNQGTTLSRIRGIELSRGDYLGFLDDDDIALNNNLMKQLDAMILGDYDFVFCDYIINNLVDNKRLEKQLYQYGENFKKNILYSPAIFLQCCLFKKNFVLNNLCCFDYKSEPSEDWDFFISLSKLKPKIKHIKFYGFQWNYSKESQSYNYKKETLALEYIVNKHCDYMKRYSKNYLSLQYRKLGSMFFYLKNQRQSTFYFKHASVTWPWSLKNIALNLIKYFPKPLYLMIMEKYVKKII